MSLTRTTILTLAALLTCVGLFAGGASYWISAREANEFLDLLLRQVAEVVGNGDPTATTAALPPHDNEDELVVEVRFHDGRPAICLAHPCWFKPVSETGFSDLNDPSGSWRVFSLVTPDRTVQVGQRQQVRSEIASGAAIASLLPILLLIPIMWIVVGAVLRRTFGRLAQVTREIAGRDASDVAPIPYARVPAEVQPLVQAMDGLLARLRHLMDQQRGFVADAAHQLRTPLAALTLELGNLRSSGEGPAAVERLAFVEAAARRATGLVTQLLRLARQEAGTRREPAVVALREVVLETIETLAPLAIDRQIDLGLVAAVDAYALGDREDLRTLLDILVDNAVRYTPAGGEVDVEMREDRRGTAICVRDTGPGIPPEVMPRIFERFFRVEEWSAEGTGLGLAIAELIASRHGITLTIANRTDRSGIEARVLVPRLKVAPSVGRAGE
jgi:two-component system, OmpR family, sensor kinase